MNSQEKLFVVKYASALGRRALTIERALAKNYKNPSLGNFPVTGGGDWKKYVMSEADKMKHYELQGSGRRGGGDLGDDWAGGAVTMRSQKKGEKLHGDKRPRDIPGHPHYEGKPSIESLGGYDSLRELVEKAIRLGYIKKESPVSALMKL